jgi:general secretion pathway protein E
MPAGLAALEDRIVARLGVSVDAVENARARRREIGGSLADMLSDGGAVDGHTWTRAVADETGLPFRELLATDGLDPAIRSCLPMGVAMRHTIVPLAVIDGVIEVALSDIATPDAAGLLEDLRLLFSLPVRPVLAPAPVIREAITRAYDTAPGPAATVLEGMTAVPLARLAATLEAPRDLLDGQADAPLIRFVNTLLAEALAAHASDIHLGPSEHGVLVRFRIDGILQDILTPPRHLQAALVSRLKVMAGLDIAERRLPQDGRMRVRAAGRDVDVRVSTVPTIFGERTVLRLLDQAATPLALDQLGLRAESLASITQILTRSHGIVLSTGPTGSGKTTTLYAALSHIASHDRSTKNIITIEDPVEYRLPGIGQIQVNPKIDLTFTHGLRSILRQDPDVIMVGEIRDRETAEIAIHAALTGHLVLSTLHTTDAAGAVTRLLDMGVEPFLVSSALAAVIGQRLVRRVCHTCRERATADTWSAGGGCRECRGAGYRGRTGIYELLRIEDSLRTLIMQRADATTMRHHLGARGMRTLRDEGTAVVHEGTTTMEELIRVIREDDA